jgi:5-methylcytosine-specific restriction endonuclease McrA
MKLSYYRNRADKALQKSLTAINKNCELCSKPVSCMHHFYPKSSCSALRYEEDNMIPVCVGCHLGFHSNRSADFIGRTIERRGLDWFNGLQKMRNRIVKPTIQYYKDIYDFYSNKS